MSYFLMINFKATSNCSRLHVWLVILCWYETAWRWHLCAKTCSSWHFTWSVFCDSCFIVFYWVHFVCRYIECNEIHSMNSVILVSNSPVTPPRLVALRLTTTVLYHTCATLHCTLGTARPVLVASCVHNNTQQTVTGICVTDTHRLYSDRRSTFSSATSRYYVIQPCNSMEGMQENSLKCQWLASGV